MINNFRKEKEEKNEMHLMLEQIAKTAENTQALLMMEKEDRERMQRIEEKQNEQDKTIKNLEKIVQTEVKISTGAKSKITRQTAELVDGLCTEYDLSPMYCKSRIFPIINNYVKGQCGDAPTKAEIERIYSEKAIKLSAPTKENINMYGRMRRFQQLLFEVANNDGKPYTFKENKDKRDFANAFDVHCELGDIQEVTIEQLLEEINNKRNKEIK